MADQLKFADCMSFTGDYLGWGKGADAGDVAWDTRKAADLKFWCSYGAQQFYKPPILPGERISYQWSFLYPIAEFPIPAGSKTIALPRDFAGFRGTMGLLDSNRAPFEIKQADIKDIYRAYEAFPQATGQPQFACAEPLKTVTAVQGQQWQLHVFPVPDQDYTLTCRYKIEPAPLTSHRPFIYGGGTHALTVFASCLAAVELYRDNIRGGPLYANFMDRLAVSVSQDREFKPEFLGYNADRSDWQGFDRSNRHRWGNTITVNGLEPT